MPASTPDAVAGLNIASLANESVTLAWAAPTLFSTSIPHTYNLELLEYMAEFCSSTAGCVQRSLLASATDTSYTGLTPKTDYTFTL